MARYNRFADGIFDGALSRRDLLRLSAAGVLGGCWSGWLAPLASQAATDSRRRGSCILLWMNGGPSQMDTFDLKPGNPNGGLFKEIATSVPGIRISEHLPQLARLMDHVAIIRSMSTKEGDHARATRFVRTGYRPVGPVEYPTFGSLVAKELGRDDAELPNFVSIAPYRAIAPSAFAPGFLGPQYAPLIVGETAPTNNAGNNDGDDNAKSGDDGLQVADLAPPAAVTTATSQARVKLLDSLNTRFSAGRHQRPVAGHVTAYQQAVRLMRSGAAGAFKLDDEPAALRDAYGRNRFGQSCLLARRLVERGVPFVEVTLGGITSNGLGWDTHADNFDGVRQLSEVLDPAWSTLMTDLKSRGLLYSTLIVWMGEFGRTPKINDNAGRDHYPQAWSTVLAGGGIKGGQVIGRTSADGSEVEDRAVSVPDLLATVCTALGIDPMKQNDSNIGRPIRIVDPKAQPIREILSKVT